MNRKQELRAEILAIRAALPPDVVVRAEAAVCHRVLDRPEFREARTILAYADVRNEVGTAGLIRAALAAGKRVALPVTDRERQVFTPVRVVRYPEDLVPGAYGIPEPRGGAEIPPGELDCILLPGVAYDHQGYRLGYGGGYYDRFLARVPAHTVRIGLAYEFQVCPTVYPEPHDRPVHLVVTEIRTLPITAR